MERRGEGIEGVRDGGGGGEGRTARGLKGWSWVAMSS